MRFSDVMFESFDMLKEYLLKTLPNDENYYIYITKKSSNIKSKQWKYLLFTYNEYLAGYANIENCIIENIKYKDDKYEYNYKIKVNEIKLIPLVKLEKAGDNDNILMREKGTRGVALYLCDLKNEQILFREYKDILKDYKLYQEFISNEKKNSIIRQTNLHRYEDMHSNFLVNFIKNDNIFKPGTILFEKLLNLVGIKFNNIDSFSVNPRCTFEKNDVKCLSNVKIKNIKPDIFITYKTNNEEKYIIIETKLQAIQSEYETSDTNKKMKQTEAYYKYFKEKYGNKISFVFLSMYDENKCKDVKDIKKYIKITFQQLIDKVYEPNVLHNNQEVLVSYLHSFHIMYHNDFYSNYYFIPDTHLLVDEVKKLKKDKLFVELIKNITSKTALCFTSDDEVAYFKYLLHVYDDKLLCKIIKLINK